MPHLRYSGLPAEQQQAVFLDIVRSSPLLTDVLNRAQRLNLPDWYIVSGAVYNLVWNVLTGRPETHGIKDVDLFYYDASDISYEAEDRIDRGVAVTSERCPRRNPQRNDRDRDEQAEQHRQQDAAVHEVAADA